MEQKKNKGKNTGFDIRNSNTNNRVFDEMKEENIPDVVIVKKVVNLLRKAV